MTIVSVAKDPENLTLTIVSEFSAEPSAVWDVWEDPRKLERWWGPPTYPATFTRHDFVVGGESRYYMSGPDEHTPRGWWRMNNIDKPNRLDFVNGLASDDGEPAPGVEPMGAYVIFTKFDGGTRMAAVSVFADTAQMELMISMGMEEGMRAAGSQIDALLSTTTA